MFAKSLVLAFFAAGLVYGRCPNQQKVTVESDDDVEKLFDQSCDDFSGDIVLGQNVKSPSFPYLRRIDGDFTVNNAVDMVSLSAPKLSVVSGQFMLKECTTLREIDTPQLSEVGSLKLQTLPALVKLGMNITKAGNVLITDTTLTSLEGLNVVEVDNYSVDNNRFLKLMILALERAMESITISSNGKNLRVTFTDLVSANNISIRDATLVTMPALEMVNSSATFFNYGSSSIAFPLLNEVGGSFSFAKCPQLSKISSPKLKEVGGTFLLANNTNLAAVEGFPKLTKVGGSVDFSGKFKKVTLPSLDDVRGSFNLQTTEKLDCDAFDKLRDNDVVKGEYTCADEKDTASSITTDGLSTEGEGEGSNGKDSSATSLHATASGIGMAIVAFAVGVSVL